MIKHLMWWLRSNTSKSYLTFKPHIENEITIATRSMGTAVKYTIRTCWTTTTLYVERGRDADQKETYGKDFGTYKEWKYVDAIVLTGPSAGNVMRQTHVAVIYQ